MRQTGLEFTYKDPSCLGMCSGERQSQAVEVQCSVAKSPSRAAQLQHPICAYADVSLRPASRHIACQSPFQSLSEPSAGCKVHRRLELTKEGKHPGHSNTKHHFPRFIPLKTCQHLSYHQIQNQRETICEQCSLERRRRTRRE